MKSRFIGCSGSALVFIAGGIASAFSQELDKKLGKSNWATPPYITLSQRKSPSVEALPVHGSIEWTLSELPFIDDGPEDGISGAALVHYRDSLYLAGGFIPGGDETDDPSRRTSRWTHRYDLKSGQWTKLPDMPGRKEYTRGFAQGDDVYIVGGLTQKSKRDGSHGPSAEVFKLTDLDDQPRWETHSRLNVPRTHPSAGAIGGFLIVAGGNEYLYDRAKGILGMHTVTMRDTTEVFDLGNPTSGWQLRKPVPSGPRGWCGSAVVGDRFYLFAGIEVVPTSAGKQARLKLNETLSYNPKSDEWFRHADAPFRISGWAGSTLRDRYVVLVGGVQAKSISAEKMGQNTWNDMVFAYDTQKDRWLRFEGLVPPGGVYNDAGVVVIGDTIYVLGGEGPRGSHFDHFLIGKIRLRAVDDSTL